MCAQQVLYLTSHCHGVYVLNMKLECETLLRATVGILQDLFIVIHTLSVGIRQPSKKATP